MFFLLISIGKFNRGASEPVKFFVRWLVIVDYESNGVALVILRISNSVDDMRSYVMNTWFPLSFGNSLRDLNRAVIPESKLDRVALSAGVVDEQLDVVICPPVYHKSAWTALGVILVGP